MYATLIPKPLRLPLRRARHQRRLRVAARANSSRLYQPLFVLALPRTGSSMLLDCLGSIDGVSVIDEVLNPTLVVGVRQRWISKRQALGHVSRSLDSLPDPIRATKFLLSQLKLHDISLDDLRRQIPSAKYLLIYREALLEQYLSFQTASSTGQWHDRGEGAKASRGPLRIEISDLERFCRRQREKWREVTNFPWLAERAALVGYEELIADRQTVFEERIFPLLGLPSAPIATSLNKLGVKPLEERIGNYAEIVERVEPSLLRLTPESIGWQGAQVAAEIAHQHEASAAL
jgi:LPS sulfotransferase NodH